MKVFILLSLFLSSGVLYAAVSPADLSCKKDQDCIPIILDKSHCCEYTALSTKALGHYKSQFCPNVKCAAVSAKCESNICVIKK